MSALDEIFNWLFKPRPQQHIDSGWRLQRDQETGEHRFPDLRAGGQRIEYGAAQYPYHQQDPVRIRPGDLMRAARQQQKQAPRTQNTEGIPRLALPSPKTPNPLYDERALSELETNRRGLPGIPKWVLEQLPGNALPVQRPVSASVTPDASLLATMRVDRSIEPEPWLVESRKSSVLDTWQSPEKQQETIAALIKRYDSGRLPPMEPLPAPVDADEWLNSVLPEQQPTQADKARISELLTLTEADCLPDLTDEDGTAEASALLKLRYCEHKESESK